MPINISYLDEKSMIVEYAGLVTKEQVLKHSQDALLLNMPYVIVDDRNMMLYSDDTLYDEEVQKIVEKGITRDTLKHIIMIIPEDHDLRQRVHANYKRLNILHKLTFVNDMDSAKQVLFKLQQEHQD